MQTIRQAAEQWNISERRVTALCRSGRIEGAVKNGKLWLIPDGAPAPLDGRTRAYAQKKAERADSAAARFAELYKKPAPYSDFSPTWLCPLGAHLDHQHGVVTGFCVDKGIHIAYGPKQNGVIEITLMHHEKRAQWHAADTPGEKQGDWADHLRGAVWALSRQYSLHIGLCAVICAELPFGEQTAVASASLHFLAALCRFNGITLSAAELLAFVRQGLAQYVGVQGGSCAQICSLYARKNALLQFDAQSGSHRSLAARNMPPFTVGLFFCEGSEKNTLNSRVDECKAAAFALCSFSGSNVTCLNDAALRQIPQSVFAQYRRNLPPAWQKRAAHYYGEAQRVQSGIAAWQQSDLAAFGELMRQSGRSSIDNWEVGSEGLRRLFDELCRTDGVYGCRFVGTGYKGCCMALLRQDDAEKIAASVSGADAYELCSLCDGNCF